MRRTGKRGWRKTGRRGGGGQGGKVESERRKSRYPRNSVYHIMDCLCVRSHIRIAVGSNHSPLVVTRKTGCCGRSKIASGWRVFLILSVADGREGVLPSGNNWQMATLFLLSNQGHGR